MTQEKFKKFICKWRITEMALWDKDFIDLMGEGYFQFDKAGLGEFQFGAVQGNMDWWVQVVDGKNRAEFCWTGFDEMDPASGKGWAEVDGEMMTGHIQFHQGDDSGFTATRKA